MIDTFLNFITTYFWQVLAITLPCLAGFAVTQVWKVSVQPKPPFWRIYTMNAGVTTLLCSIAWSNVGSVQEAFTVGLITGLCWPFGVLVWFALAKRAAPEAYEKLTGSGDDITIIPGFDKKK